MNISLYSPKRDYNKKFLEQLTLKDIAHIFEENKKGKIKKQ